jgi:hypothetical protein
MNYTQLRYTSRKFLLALLALSIGTVALFTEYLDGAQFVTLVSIVLGLYGTAQVVDKRLNGGLLDEMRVPTLGAKE